MTVFTEGRHPGEFLMSEATGWRSRGKGIIKAGSGVFEPGTIIGPVAVGSASVAVKASGANTGNATLALDGTTPVLANAKAGVYTVRMTGATTFVVENPDGQVIGNGATGAAFADGVKFTMTAGATPMVAGDGFDITVALAARKYAPSPNGPAAGIEGAETACAVTLYGGDATNVDVEIAIIERDAELNRSKLVYDSTVDNTAKKNLKIAQLAAVGIIAR